MNSFPANERSIAEYERGRSYTAVVPMPTGQTVAVGDSILFALAQSRGDQEPVYVKGGDSVRVLITEVTDLGTTDPGTGLSLFQLTWVPLGLNGPPGTNAR
ncbi:MAG: hypothetical protein LC745_13460, partial [Planctomycetia bacterium]|nr:hypothetical protein [Planctomycetia bacterium]